MKKGYRNYKGQGYWMPASIKPTACEAQDYWLYPGLILIAHLPRGVAKGCHNGQLLECKALPDEDGNIALRDIESDAEMALPIQFVRDSMRLGFAFTSYSAQGRGLGNLETEKDPQRGLTVHSSHPKFNLRHLFTGTSRCRHGELLQVV